MTYFLLSVFILNFLAYELLLSLLVSGAVDACAISFNVGVIIFSCISRRPMLMSAAILGFISFSRSVLNAVSMN